MCARSGGSPCEVRAAPLGFPRTVGVRCERRSRRCEGELGHERQLVHRTLWGRATRAASRVRQPRPTGVAPKGDMTSGLEKLMANLSDSERHRLRTAFAADPELAQGLSTMLGD